MSTALHALTSAQRAHFLQHGWLRISQGVTPANIAKYMDNQWIRLGWKEHDKSTWQTKHSETTRVGEWKLNEHRSEPLKGYVTPACWAAMCQLVGGEDRLNLAPPSCTMTDALIGSFGAPETENTVVPPSQLVGWHVDGDSFVRFLDSPVGLTTLVFMTDVVENGGPTIVAEDSIKHVAQFMYDRPEGYTARDRAKGHIMDAIKSGQCTEMVYLTGKAGDVILAHPLLAHSRTHNPRRIARFIRNPALYLKEPLNFSRPDPSHYSLVEQKILAELGVSSLPNWHITGERFSFKAPAAIKREAHLHLELMRLRKWRDETGQAFESKHEQEAASIEGAQGDVDATKPVKTAVTES